MSIALETFGARDQVLSEIRDELNDNTDDHIVKLAKIRDLVEYISEGFAELYISLDAVIDPDDGFSITLLLSDAEPAVPEE